MARDYKQGQEDWQTAAKVEIERAIIASAVEVTSKDDLNLAEESLEELAELCQTAGVEVVGEVLQRLPKLDRATVLGYGKVQEIKEQAEMLEANLLIVDCELTGSQMKNLVNETGLKVIDRTTVILDIFARHAKTAEGKLQVEIAQLKSSQSRLVGLGASLSRLGGGIGTRGPGESKLELDRRHLSSRIHFLRKQLSDLESRRQRTRTKRATNDIYTVAICGYTNAGKSTLLNALCQSEVLAEDKLFATLDPILRKLQDDKSKTSILLCDTVGFIRNLPHHLVEVFQSTLAEIADASAILVVVDITDEALKTRLAVVEAELKRLEATTKPILYAFNKIDLLEPDEVVLRMIEVRPYLTAQAQTCLIAAKTGEGLEELKALLFASMWQNSHRYKIKLPQAEMDVLSFLHRNGLIHSQYATTEYLEIEVTLPKRYVYKIEPWLE